MKQYGGYFVKDYPPLDVPRCDLPPGVVVITSLRDVRGEVFYYLEWTESFEYLMRVINQEEQLVDVVPSSRIPAARYLL